MPENGVRSTYSQAPFKIYMYDRGGLISTGTAFNYIYKNHNCIITNWHNFSGKDFFTRKCIDKKNARTPLWIEADTGAFVGSEDITERGFKIFRRRIDIYHDPCAQFDRIWLEHPTLGSEGCDIVALPIEKPSDEPNFLHNHVNQISKYRVPVRPGETAAVIGYPHGLEVGWSLPIWKSTFIASEPYYDVRIDGKDLRAFFVDGYTREGMSGSPVFAKFSGKWDLNDPYAPINLDAPDFWKRDDIALNETAMEFVGVYSGRLKQNEADAALGLVWKKELINEMLEYFQPDS